MARLVRAPIADLHVHTTASDGDYTPGQVAAIARQAGLLAVAITDHDSVAGVGEARAAAGDALEVVAGVEISTSFQHREFHLLGYFVRTNHEGLNAALATIRESRLARFREVVARLRESGLPLPDDRVQLVEQSTTSLGRRHVAGLLVACGHARARSEAIYRFVNPHIGKAQPKALLPLPDAIHLVHAAGGVASLAHPPAELIEADFGALRACDLDALEVEYPWNRSSSAARLRKVAAQYDFAVSGGSDCHGPDPAHRRIGTHGINSAAFAALRDRAGCAVG